MQIQELQSFCFRIGISMGKGLLVLMQGSSLSALMAKIVSGPSIKNNMYFI